MPSVAVSASSSGDNTVLAAQGSGTFIRVWGFSLIAASAVSAKWKSGSTDKTGAYPLAANGGLVREAGSTEPVFTCGNNEALVLNLSSGVQVSGEVSYTVFGIASS